MLAFKTELAPNRQQAHEMNCTFGVVRVAYNRYLDAAKQHYASHGSFLSGYEYSKQLNHQNTEDWFRAVSSKAVKQAILNGDSAFRKFFSGKAGYPRTKKKGTDADSYYLIGAIHVERHRVKLPCLGWVRLKEKGYIPTDLKPRIATVTREAGRYYVSVLFDIDEPEHEQPDGDVLGMDVGLKSLAVLSDGTMLTDYTLKTSAHHCEHASITVQEANKLLDDWHVQGKTKNQEYCYALKYNGEPVAVATFAHARFNKSYEYEWIRYAVKPGVQVYGGQQALFAMFTGEVHPSSVISYVDYNHTTRERTFMDGLGFTMDGYTGPTLVWSKGNKRITDSALRQHGADQLLNTSYGSREESGMNNHDIMEAEGWLPVYTAGNRRYTWHA